MCLCVCSRRARHPIETKADENHGEKTFLGCLEGPRCWEGPPLCDRVAGDLIWGGGGAPGVFTGRISVLSLCLRSK